MYLIVELNAKPFISDKEEITMHMADALLSPVVGGAMTAVSAASIAYSVKKAATDKLDEKKIPMMGVMGAFIFSAQMINFTLPGTGSSGHISGGILLAALLGPFPALLTLASVLLIQCLLFADGGLLAYGCNVFNIGVCTCLLAYQFLFKPIVKSGMSKRNIILASVVSAVAGLQMGAFSVVMETFASGVTELPFSAFIVLMQPIHLVIGLVEGIVTAAVLYFIHSVRPELLDSSIQYGNKMAGISLKKTIVTFLIITAFVGGGLSPLASSFPDGLEWSIEEVTGEEELARSGEVYDAMGSIVNSTAIMPDYAFAGDEDDAAYGTAAASIVGSVITIMLAGGVGLIIRLVRKKALYQKHG